MKFVRKILIFAFIAFTLCMGVAYAATNGQLTFGGVAYLAPADYAGGLPVIALADPDTGLFFTVSAGEGAGTYGIAQAAEGLSGDGAPPGGMAHGGEERNGNEFTLYIQKPADECETSLEIGFGFQNASNDTWTGARITARNTAEPSEPGEAFAPEKAETSGIAWTDGVWADVYDKERFEINVGCDGGYGSAGSLTPGETAGVTAKLSYRAVPGLNETVTFELWYDVPVNSVYTPKSLGFTIRFVPVI